jgi:hypothetical protein
MPQPHKTIDPNLQVDGVISTEIVFPDNVLYWANVPSAKDTKLEVWIVSSVVILGSFSRLQSG